MYKNLLIVLMLVSSLFMFFVPTADAASGDVTTGFEDGTVTQDYSNEWLVTHEDASGSGTFKVDNTGPRTGNRNFVLIDVPGTGGAFGTWNLTYDSNFMNFSGYIKYQDGWVDEFSIYGRNSDGDTIIQLSVYLTKTPSRINMSYFDHTGSENTIEPYNSSGNYIPFSFEMIANDTIIYGFNDTFIEDSPRYVRDNCKITQLFFNQRSGNTYGVYFDDLTLSLNVGADGDVGSDTDLSDTYTSNTLGCGITGYMPIMGFCSFSGVTHTQVLTDDLCYTDCLAPYYHQSQYIEVQHNDWVLDSTIYVVDLPVGGEQYSLVSSTLTDYRLYINEIGAYTATSWIDLGNGNYILRWSIPVGVSLANETPIFEFKSLNYFDDPTYGRYYWFLGVMPHECEFTSRKHDTPVNWGDGELDGAGLHGCQFGLQNYVSPALTYWYTQGDLPIVNASLDDYTAIFGDFFIQFNKYEVLCNHIVGKPPVIAYKLNDALYSDIDGYIFDIIDEDGDIVYTNPIFFPGSSVSRIETITDWQFTSVGHYYIRLWNLTSGFERGELVYMSQTIRVCLYEGGGVVDPDIDPDPSPFVFDFSDIPVLYKVIISLFIIICLTISPYFFAAMINRGRTSVEMPDLVYVAFFFIGVVASIMLGFLEIWVFFVILVGLIITFAIFWLQGKDIGGGE